jgi:glutamate-1-semialdehyde 2,1-aminomutase
MERFDPGRSDRIAHSGTFNGNPVSMAAGLAAVDLLTPESIQRIDALGESLACGIRSAFDRAGVAAHVTRGGSLVQIHFTRGPVRDYRSAARADLRARALLHLALLNRGVFCGSRLNFNTSTVMDAACVAAVVDALEEATHQLGAALPMLG